MLKTSTPGPNTSRPERASSPRRSRSSRGEVRHHHKSSTILSSPGEPVRTWRAEDQRPGGKKLRQPRRTQRRSPFGAGDGASEPAHWHHPACRQTPAEAVSRMSLTRSARGEVGEITGVIERGFNASFERIENKGDVPIALAGYERSWILALASRPGLSSRRSLNAGALG